MRRILMCLAGVAVLLASAGASAGQTDNLYDLQTKAPGPVTEGQAGKAEIKIKTKKGAHVSDEAPVKIQVNGKNVKVSKEKLTRSDAIKSEDGPRFEIPFTAEGAGAGALDADMTFFICTDKICERQQRKVSIPVDVK